MRNAIIGSFIGFVLGAAFLAACGGSGGGGGDGGIPDGNYISPPCTTLEALCQRVDGLEELLIHFSRNGNDVVIDGANLHVRNGAHNTDTTNGVGNVIIGYNEGRFDDGNPFTDDSDVRTGSHMLVVGMQNNFSTYGGILVGKRCETSGKWSSVCGGAGNRAQGEWSAVCGGTDNTARGKQSHVSGGAMNLANGNHSQVSGGLDNRASGQYASISGGYDNRAGATAAQVSGGNNNTASGHSAQVSGGSENTASGGSAQISGGQGNTASHEGSQISAGPGIDSFNAYWHHY